MVSCSEMRDLRIEALPDEPVRQEGETDDAYKARWIEYYGQLRQAEAGYRIEHVTQQAYTLCKEVNSDVAAYSDNKDNPKLKGTLYEGARSFIAGICGKKIPTKAASCAATAALIDRKICADFGVPCFLLGKDGKAEGRIIAASTMNTDVTRAFIEQGAKGNGPDAKRLARIQAINNKKEELTINQAIKLGIIKPGDSFGITAKTASKSHAMTLRSYNPETGAYVLQCENRPCLKDYNVNVTNCWVSGEGIPRRVVTNIVPLSAYLTSEINSECEQLQGKSLEDIQEAARQTRAKTEDAIVKLYDEEIKDAKGSHTSTRNTKVPPYQARNYYKSEGEHFTQLIAAKTKDINSEQILIAGDELPTPTIDQDEKLEVETPTEAPTQYASASVQVDSEQKLPVKTEDIIKSDHKEATELSSAIKLVLSRTRKVLNNINVNDGIDNASIEAKKIDPIAARLFNNRNGEYSA